MKWVSTSLSIIENLLLRHVNVRKSKYCSAGDESRVVVGKSFGTTNDDAFE